MGNMTLATPHANHVSNNATVAVGHNEDIYDSIEDESSKNDNDTTM
jgi:hypothetical protein